MRYESDVEQAFRDCGASEAEAKAFAAWLRARGENAVAVACSGDEEIVPLLQTYRKETAP